MQAIYRHRNWPAGLTSVAVLAFAIYSSSHRVLPEKKALVETPVEISLVTPPEPTPPEPPPPEPPKPQQRQPDPVKPQTPTPKTETPLPVSDHPTTTEVAKPPLPTPPQPVQPPPPAPAPPPPAPTVNFDAQYEARARTALEAAKRYPTGRESSKSRPQGTVAVTWTLGRDGHVVDVDIADSSNSIVLDRAAMQAVQRAVFPPFPDGAWPGQATHKFTWKLEFLPPNS